MYCTCIIIVNCIIFIDKINKQPSVPSDLLDKISAMQNAIDHLSTEVSKVTNTVTHTHTHTHHRLN